MSILSPFQQDLLALSLRSRRGSKSRERKYRVIRDTKGHSQFCFQLDSEVQAMVAEHLAYLNRMAKETVVSSELARRAKVVWHVARISADGELPVPAAVAYKGGPIEYHWEIGPHQLSTEIPEAGSCHWFYRNKTTGEVWGGENVVEDGLSSRIIHYLDRLVASNS